MRYAFAAFAVVFTAGWAFGGQQDSSPGTAQAPVRVGGDVRMPRKIRDVPPVYPPIAQSARVQGVVILETLVGTDGKVISAKVLRSIPLLDQAAIDAVRQWEFEPTRLNGAAVRMVVTTTVSFLLDSATGSASETQGPSAAPGPSTQGRAGLAEALKNLQKYVRREEFRHPQAQASAAVEVDFKSTSADPWLRRFVAQLKGHWPSPVSLAQVARNTVRFRVQRDGRITDVTLTAASGVALYDTLSLRTITNANPAEPLPAEVEKDFLQFNVTFSYNEPPPTRTAAPAPAGNQPIR